MRKIPLIILIMLLTFKLWSQEIIQQTTIPFGPEKSQISIDQGAGEHWKPLFFSIDSNRKIHIPDFYKSRIAIFDFKGKLINEITVPEGLSPRMNFFALSPKNYYISFSDSTLYCINPDGKLNWKHNLGLGFIPQSLYVNEVAIFLVPSGEDQRALVYDYLNNTPLGRIGFMIKSKGIPIIQSASQKPYTLHLENMKLIPDSPYPQKGFSSDYKAFLMNVDEHGKSYWKTKKSNFEKISIFDDQGKLITIKAIYYINSNINGNGFWTVASEKYIYKNYFKADQMLITEYLLE